MTARTRGAADDALEVGDGKPAPIDDRVPATFDPIIGELRAAGRHVDAGALAARKGMILDANGRARKLRAPRRRRCCAAR